LCASDLVKGGSLGEIHKKEGNSLCRGESNKDVGSAGDQCPSDARGALECELHHTWSCLEIRGWESFGSPLLVSRVEGHANPQTSSGEGALVSQGQGSGEVTGGNCEPQQAQHLGNSKE
jgi:hypothetical protein